MVGSFEQACIQSLGIVDHLCNALRTLYPSLESLSADVMYALLDAGSAEPLTIDQLLQAVAQLVAGEHAAIPPAQSEDAFIKEAYGEWGRLWMFYQQFRLLTLQHRCVVGWRQRILADILEGKLERNVYSAVQRLRLSDQKQLGVPL
jgi:hypothetical protein